jgi:hypothetical protein
LPSIARQIGRTVPALNGGSGFIVGKIPLESINCLPDKIYGHLGIFGFKLEEFATIKFMVMSEKIVYSKFLPIGEHTGDLIIYPRADRSVTLGGWLKPSLLRSGCPDAGYFRI